MFFIKLLSIELDFGFYGFRNELFSEQGKQ